LGWVIRKGRGSLGRKETILYVWKKGSHWGKNEKKLKKSQMKFESSTKKNSNEVGRKRGAGEVEGKRGDVPKGSKTLR